MKGLHVLHNLYCTVSYPKPYTIDQEPQDDECIQHKDGSPVPDPHELGRQEGTIGSRLRGHVNPTIRQGGEYECNGWRCDGSCMHTCTMSIKVIHDEDAIVEELLVPRN